MLRIVHSALGVGSGFESQSTQSLATKWRQTSAHGGVPRTRDGTLG